jgi:hypothetical protein
MKEHMESSSNLSESSKDNWSTGSNMMLNDAGRTQIGWQPLTQKAGRVICNGSAFEGWLCWEPACSMSSQFGYFIRSLFSKSG